MPELRWRRVAPVEHVHFDLETEKLGDVVQEMRYEEMQQMEEKRGAGVVVRWPELEILPGNGGAARSSTAAWRHFT